MGPGGSREAEYDLKASVPAGTYHFVCDSIVIRPIDVTFEFIHRRGDGDTVLATHMQTFNPLPNGQFKAQPCELDLDAPAIDFQPGDQFVWRYSGANSTSMMAWIPNGDGHLADGRIPNITLPK